jgi:hypothetical protein
VASKEVLCRSEHWRLYLRLFYLCTNAHLKEELENLHQVYFKGAEERDISTDICSCNIMWKAEKI